ncbi:hypothetical protein K438DRAFT_209880 [Mycena galopus ATCC 62051]|nr:hypothetical protein K438DRAFT_209880 [Mycena galopus ATCC 62051]
MLEQFPPEILGHVCLLGTEAWGIGFLPTICLVSSACRDVVVSTPTLWGVLTVNKRSSFAVLNRQLAKAKATDLRIAISSKGWRAKDKHGRQFLASLMSLAPNWVRAELPTHLLASAKWADMGRVEVLHLRFHGATLSTAEEFFGSEGAAFRKSNLRSFIGIALPEEWVRPLLSPCITSLELGRLGGRYGGRYGEIPASLIHEYLALTPNVHTLCLQHLVFLPFSASKNPVSLRNLDNLELARVRELTPLLLNMRAPALRALIVRDSTGQMGSVFSQWSQPNFLPAHLQFLELANCLSPRDIPLLVGFLARLPALLRLIIFDTGDIGGDLSSASSAETDLFKALASPDGAGPVIGGWLCPSLIHLCIDAPLRVADILPIVCARGGTTPRTAGSPAKLRSLQGPLCSGAAADEMAELRSYFADPEEVRCLCLSCSFDFSVTI